jgi:hypothetical protein
MAFDPITLMTIAKFASVAGSAVTAVGNLNASSYNAAVAERNAKRLDDNAKRVAETAQQQTQHDAEAAAQEKGSALAAASASGVDLFSGSSLLQTAALDRLARRDANRTMDSARTDIWQLQQDATDLRNTAKQTRKMGRIQLFSDIGTGFSSFMSDSTAINKAKLDLLK